MRVAWRALTRITHHASHTTNFNNQLPDGLFLFYHSIFLLYNIPMSKYALLLLLSGIIPLICSFGPALKFYKNLKSLLLSLVLITFIFGGWDIFAVLRGHWYFDPEAVAGFNIFNLPLEELLFFPVISFCCIFSWEAVNFIMNKR
jgi:lycopene cyclase domain-containing protein